MNKSLLICQLPKQVQEEIKKALNCAGLCFKDIQRGMAGKVCDLEDTIDIYDILRREKQLVQIGLAATNEEEL